METAPVMGKAKLEIFTSPTCPHCPHAMKVAKEVVKERGDVKLVDYNTATREGVRKAEFYAIRGTPTIIISGPAIYDKIGIVGVPSKRELNRALDKAVGAEEEEEAASEGGFFSKIKSLFKG